MERDLQVQLDALKSDLTTLRTDLTGAVQAIKDMTARGIEVAKATLEGEANQMRTEFRSALDEARQRGKASAIMLEQQIEKNPYASIVGAFGLGLLLGRLLDRR
jgi:ElaB/YqjD/DUF883 family membrane-anchored ribosome-binding protein